MWGHDDRAYDGYAKTQHGLDYVEKGDGRRTPGGGTATEHIPVFILNLSLHLGVIIVRSLIIQFRGRITRSRIGARIECNVCIAKSLLRLYARTREQAAYRC